MKKQWNILPAIGKEFAEKNPDLSKIVLQLLFNRGITEKEEIKEFLNPTVDGNDPFLFNDMEKAVALIIKHIKRRNKIAIYGDYDADGVTATAVLMDALGTLKAEVEPYIPDRVTEGYGLNKEALKELAKGGAKLVITVDGGIRAKEEIEYAKKLNLETVVTDHHLPPEDAEELPACPIINPLVKGEKYPFKDLAGVGVAFKLAKAVIKKSTLSDRDKEKLEKRVLDLVAIGTVADCVSLLGENRVLVKTGLEAANFSARIGLRELVKTARINGNKRLDSWNIGFQIAPRINAAGRMDHANTALELLITKNEEEAASIARRLNDRNIERQTATDEIVARVTEEIEKKPLSDKMVVAVSPKEEIWNEGVVGLAAGRISDRYYLPVLVITESEDGYKGSGRSIKEFNIMEAMNECSDLLLKYGGHTMACGFSLREKNLEKFKERIIKIANRKLKKLDLTPKIDIEAEINLEEVDEYFAAEVEKFAPFGQGNDRPKFMSREAVIADIFTMGLEGQHIKLKIKARQSKKNGVIDAVGFGQAEQWKDLRIGDIIDIAYYVEINEFNGRSSAQLKIIDIKPSEN